MPYDPNNPEDEQQASGAAPQNSAPQRFVTFDQYLGANKPAADRMAQNTVKRVSEQATNAKTTADNEAAGAKAQVNAGVTKPTVAAQNNPNPASYTPTAATPGTYAGPDFFAFADPTRAAMMGAQTQLNALSNPYGMQTLAAEQNKGQANTSAGMSRFDGALMGGAGRKQFADVQQRFAGLGSYLGNLESSVASSITAAKAEQDRLNTEAQAQADAANVAAEQEWRQAAFDKDRREAIANRGNRYRWEDDDEDSFSYEP